MSDGGSQHIFYTVIYERERSERNERSECSEYTPAHYTDYGWIAGSLSLLPVHSMYRASILFYL